VTDIIKFSFSETENAVILGRDLLRVKAEDSFEGRLFIPSLHFGNIMDGMNLMAITQIKCIKVVNYLLAHTLILTGLLGINIQYFISHVNIKKASLLNWLFHCRRFLNCFFSL